MFKKLEELKQDVTDGISSVAQRSVQAVQELINSPYTAVELSQKEIEFYGDIVTGEIAQCESRYCTVDVFKQSTLIKTDKWIDALLENPRLVDGRKQSFRFFRLPIAKEIEAVQQFPVISLIFHELDIAALYSQNILQLVLNSIKREPGWTSAHVAVDISLKSVFTIHSLPSKRLQVTSGDSLGRSPLQLAVRQLKRDFFEHLIVVGAQTNVQDCIGDTIYHYFLQIGDEGSAYFQYLVNDAPLQHPDKAMDLINMQGDSPLHICAREGRDRFLYTLLESGASPSIDSPNGRVLHLILKHAILTDEKRRFDLVEKVLHHQKCEVHAIEMKFGGTALHWARTKADVEQLIKHGAALDSKSYSKDTPLHIMIQKNRTDAAYCVILHGADVSDVGSNGNTPLHYAIMFGNIKLVKALLLFGANYNKKNVFGKTPGLLAIENRNKHGDAILLLMQEVGSMSLGHSNSPIPNTDAFKFPNIAPESTFAGTPIRFSELKAKEGEYIDDNENIESPIETRPIPILTCDHEMSAISRSRSANLGESRIPKSEPVRTRSMDHIEELKTEQKRRKKLRILCLDGGGIRGLVLTQMLIAIEQEAQRPIHTLFDYISGTSTGGMAALGFLLKYRPTDLQRFYLKLKDDCFQGKRPYAEGPLENNLKELFGEQTRMLDFTHPRVLVTSVLADRQPADLFLFRSYVPSGAIDDIPSKTTDGQTTFDPIIEYQNEFVWKAARCTGAAPTYFPAMGRFLDGGLAANNPTLDTIVEVTREITATNKDIPDDEKESIKVIVSIGTGNQPVARSRATDRIWPTNALEAYKSITATVELLKIFVDTVCEADRWVTTRARTWCDMANIKYFRLNPQLTNEVGLDETDNDKLFQLMWESRKYINQNKEYIREIVQQVL